LIILPPQQSILPISSTTTTGLFVFLFVIILFDLKTKYNAILSQISLNVLAFTSSGPSTNPQIGNTGMSSDSRTNQILIGGILGMFLIVLCIQFAKDDEKILLVLNVMYVFNRWSFWFTFNCGYDCIDCYCDEKKEEERKRYLSRNEKKIYFENNIKPFHCLFVCFIDSKIHN
jgi:hypothetical protein